VLWSVAASLTSHYKFSYKEPVLSEEVTQVIFAGQHVEMHLWIT